MLCLVDYYVFDARTQFNFFGKVKAVNGRKFNRSVGLVMFTVTLLKLVAFEDVRFTVSPAKLKNFLRI